MIKKFFLLAMIVTVGKLIKINNNTTRWKEGNLHVFA